MVLISTDTMTNIASKPKNQPGDSSMPLKTPLHRKAATMMATTQAAMMRATRKTLANTEGTGISGLPRSIAARAGAVSGEATRPGFWRRNGGFEERTGDLFRCIEDGQSVIATASDGGRPLRRDLGE